MNGYTIYPADKCAYAALALAWEKLKAARLVAHVWYDGSVKTEGDFARFCMDDNGNAVYVLQYSGVVMGMAWLNSFEGKVARAHFTALPNAAGHTVGMGIAFTRWALTATVNGEQWLNTLVGVTPEPYKLAIRYVTRRLGFREVGRIPEAVNLPGYGWVDGVVTTLNRRDI